MREWTRKILDYLKPAIVSDLTELAQRKTVSEGRVYGGGFPIPRSAFCHYIYLWYGRVFHANTNRKGKEFSEFSQPPSSLPPPAVLNNKSGQVIFRCLNHPRDPIQQHGELTVNGRKCLSTNCQPDRGAPCIRPLNARPSLLGRPSTR